MKKAVVLSSGGVDSTTCVGIAVNELGKENVITVSFYYGQKHDKELKCAKEIANYYGVAHKVIDISKTGIMDASDCTLLKRSKEQVPEGDYAKQIGKEENGKVSTYVPFRNGLLIASIAAFAMSMYPKDDVDIYLGAHADDAAGNAYADCSKEFTDSMGLAVYLGTYKKVTLCSPLVKMTKAEVVKKGLELNVPYKLTWSCYNGGDKPCGKCGTCIDRAKAFELNGIKDPAVTED